VRSRYQECEKHRLLTVRVRPGETSGDADGTLQRFSVGRASFTARWRLKENTLSPTPGICLHAQALKKNEMMKNEALCYTLGFGQQVGVEIGRIETTIDYWYSI
jgi:hypothetical protein